MSKLFLVVSATFSLCQIFGSLNRVHVSFLSFDDFFGMFWVG